MDDKEPAPQIDFTLWVIAIIAALGLGAVAVSYVLSSYRTVLEWFQSPAVVMFFLIFKITIVTLDIALGAWFLATLIKFVRLRKIILAAEIAPVPPALAAVLPQKEIQENWDQIRGLLNSDNASDWNIALLRADALFDDLLLHLGYVGDGFAERLKLVSLASLPSLDEIWSAHRLRNMIAHDPVQSHTKETISYALKSYEQGFRELKLLLPDSPQVPPPTNADESQAVRTVPPSPPPDLPV